MTFRERLDLAIAPHLLLQHPFYRAWTAGTMSRDALRHYARAYYPHVEAFPTYVSAVHSRCGEDLEARQSLLENLLEEERGDRNHAALWLDFAEGVGATAAELRAGPTDPAAAALVASFRALTQSDAGSGAAALYAYEAQIPAVAEAKIAGLRAHYGVAEARTLAFFEVHRELDVYHSAATAIVAERLSGDPDRAVAAAAEGARALWKFLDAMPN